MLQTKLNNSNTRLPFGIEGFIASFLARHSINSTHTERSYRADIFEYLTFCRDARLKVNTLDSVNGYFLHLAQKEPKLKPRTIHRKLAANSSLMTSLLKQSGLPGANSFLTLKKPRLRSTEIHFAEEDIERFLMEIDRETNLLKRLRDSAIFNILIETGFRMQTIVNLSLNDARISSEGLLLFTVKEKGNKMVTRAVREETKETLLEYLRHLLPYFKDGASDKIFRSLQTIRETGRAHSLRVNACLSTGGLRKIFRCYAEQAGFRGPVHALRAYSGYKVYKKFGVLAAQNHLAHSTPKITENYIRKFFKYDKVEILTAFD